MNWHCNSANSVRSSYHSVSIVFKYCDRVDLFTIMHDSLKILSFFENTYLSCSPSKLSSQYEIYDLSLFAWFLREPVLN